MPYDSSADTVFNPAGDPLPLISGLFKKPSLEQTFGDPFGKSDGRSEGTATRQEGSLDGDSAQGPARRARVAHLPRPPNAKAEDDFSPLFPNSTEQDVAQELLTPETFNYWKTNNSLTSREPLPSNPQASHGGIQGMKSTASATAKGPTPEWEDLSLGIQWIILLRLCEKHSFSVAVFNQLKLHKAQIHNFVTTYIALCDEWHGWEWAAVQQSALLTAKPDMEGPSLVEWLHENRPSQPVDQITEEDAQMGLQFLTGRGVFNHKIDFSDWVTDTELKCFVHIQIEKPFLEDATDLLIGAMSNDAFLGTFKDVIPFGNICCCKPVELSSQAQTVLNTISANLRIDTPSSALTSQHEIEHIKGETFKSLKNLIPELKPQYASGLLTKTRWEYDNGYPMEHVANYDLTGYTAEMQYIPEGQVHKKSSRAPTSLRGIAGKPSSQASRQFTGQKFGLSGGQPARHQTERYENRSSLCFDKSKYHSPAAFAAALAGKRNASKPRIGAAQSRFMTSNDKGQLMVGMAADTSLAAGRTSQNPRPTGLPAEGVFRTQFEVPRREMEELAGIPDLRSAEDFGAQDTTSALERNQRARRPSARARESLQIALEMAQSTEITPEKSRGKKAQCSRSSRKPADQVEDEGEGGGENDGKSSRLGSWPAQENRVEAPAAAAELIGFCIRQGNDLVHLNNPRLPSWPGLVHKAPTPEVGSKHQLVFEELGHSGSESSTTVGAQLGRPRKRQKGRSDKIFGLHKTQELNSCPPPVSAIHCAWSAEVAEFAIVAEQAYYALKADHINPAAQVPGHLQMSLGEVQATLMSKEAEYRRAESMLQGVNGPSARRAELAGVADSATFAIYATKASFALTGSEDIPTSCHVQRAGTALPMQPQ
ncbi:hypothetical protein MKX08_005792 [Trichoderma sp. CBMAI-0020]|nr:hypothetical protein MKX08_005792 [Trichoderma sp. CBMAI-0020]